MGTWNSSRKMVLERRGLDTGFSQLVRGTGGWSESLDPITL
jgi:hypothetical protein